MSSDLKFAFRQLGKSPGFALVAILTLALGIGLSASSFSLANAFLLRDVPYPEPGRLLRIFVTSRQTQNGNHAPANALDLHAAMPEMRLPGFWLLAANLGVIAVTMLLATYLPARRATRINPVEALRSE